MKVNTPELQPVRPNETVPRTIEPTVRPGDTVHVPKDSPVLPKDTPAVVAPAEHAQIQNLSRELDKLPASVPGITDARTQLNLFKENPTVKNYANLRDAISKINIESPALTAPAKIALEAARNAVVSQAVADTARSIERLLSTADMHIGNLPSGVQGRAQELLQQMRGAAQGMMTAEVASGQYSALTQLRSNTAELGQLLQQSKGAQSAIENALIQVGRAHEELAVANYIARTRDTFMGATLDFIKNNYKQIIGVTAASIELRAVLGSLAQNMEEEARKADEKARLEEKAKLEKHTEAEARKANEEVKTAQTSSPYLNSKEPMGKPPVDDTREAIRKQNRSTYGVDADYVYYQRGPGQYVVTDEAKTSAQQITNRPIYRPPGSEQQDKPSVPGFDFTKTRMPASRGVSDGPYLSTQIAFRPISGRANATRGGGNASVDPNSANSLMSKNYAFVVGPSNQGTGAVSRYGGPTANAEAVEKQNPDRSAGGGTATAQAPVMSSASTAQASAKTAPQATSTNSQTAQSGSDPQDSALSSLV